MNTKSHTSRQVVTRYPHFTRWATSRRLQSIAGAIALGTMVAACGSTTSNAISKPSSGKTIKIGFTSVALTDPVLVEALDGAKQEASSLGGVQVEYIPASTATAQLAAVQSLLADGVKAIVIDVDSESGIGSAIAQANSDHVPVITMVSPAAPTDKVAGWVGFDETQGGQLIANYIGSKLSGNATYAFMQGSEANQAGADRQQGFDTVIKKFPNLKQVDYGQGNWLRTQGYSLAQTWLAAHPNLSAIVTLSDEMALGAVTAVQQAHLQGHVIVTGDNGECAALSSIWNHNLTATVYQPWGQAGEQAIRDAYDAISGKPVAAKQDLTQSMVDYSVMSGVKSGSIKVSSTEKEAILQAIQGCPAAVSS